jgi:hypothetical protein
MPAQFTRKRLPIFVGLGALLLLSACAGNQYEAPDGQPTTWGQQHYVDNQGYQQLTTDRLLR